jgi:ferredoxin
MGTPSNPVASRNVGIPTWFYGDEPPNVFATDIAKYFENSIREEGLLAVALAGVIFAEDNAGTVQEIFQDAFQNYYRTYDEMKSPMILFGVDYWASPDMIRHSPTDKRKRVYPLLEKPVCTRCGRCADICPLKALDAERARTVEICGRKMPVAQCDAGLCAKCGNGAARDAASPGQVDRLAALCTRTCVQALEEAGALGNRFEAGFRRRPAWGKNEFGEPVEIAEGGRK